jgi:hypothetical protein
MLLKNGFNGAPQSLDRLLILPMKSHLI